jgi:DNA-binding response OmpR family regulator
MNKEMILIVDDEPGIRQLIRLFLERHHYDVIEAKNGAEGLSLLAENTVDLIVLDLMLPDVYGMDLCKKIRSTSNVPIIMLTAVHGEMNIVLGFEAGADDYVEKPFSPQILLSRIQAILKRH